jgi:hypothetical protein
MHSSSRVGLLCVDAVAVHMFVNFLLVKGVPVGTAVDVCVVLRCCAAIVVAMPSFVVPVYIPLLLKLMITAKSTAVNIECAISIF